MGIVYLNSVQCAKLCFYVRIVTGPGFTNVLLYIIMIIKGQLQLDHVLTVQSCAK